MKNKLQGHTKLEKVVASILNRKAADYSNGIAGVLKDLQHGGCQSGYIGELIYYTDTVKFYQKRKEEISGLMSDLLYGCGCSVGELLRDWDKTDPLALGQTNQNLLAWFGFEETANKLARVAGLEV